MLGRSNKNQSFGLVATSAAPSIPLLKKVVGFPRGFDENFKDLLYHFLAVTAKNTGWLVNCHQFSSVIRGE